MRAIYSNDVDRSLLNKPLSTWKNASNNRKMQLYTKTVYCIYKTMYTNSYDVFSKETERNVTQIHNLLQFLQ